MMTTNVRCDSLVHVAAFTYQAGREPIRSDFSGYPAANLEKLWEAAKAWTDSMPWEGVAFAADQNLSLSVGTVVSHWSASTWITPQPFVYVAEFHCPELIAHASQLLTEAAEDLYMPLDAGAQIPGGDVQVFPATRASILTYGAGRFTYGARMDMNPASMTPSDLRNWFWNYDHWLRRQGSSLYEVVCEWKSYDLNQLKQRNVDFLRGARVSLEKYKVAHSIRPSRLRRRRASRTFTRHERKWIQNKSSDIEAPQVAVTHRGYRQGDVFRVRACS